MHEFDGIIRENSTDVRTLWQTAYETTVGVGVTLFDFRAPRPARNEVVDAVGDTDARVHRGFDPDSSISFTDETNLLQF